MNDLLYAGIGREDITPKLGVRLGGYAKQTRPAESINDPLYSTAMAFRQGNLEAAVINLDWLGIMEDEVKRIRKEASEKTSIPPENIIITTIHTHSAPCTISIPGWGKLESEYIAEAIPAIIRSIESAYKSLKPVKLGIGRIESKTGVNRRAVTEDNKAALKANPTGIYDQEMTVIRFEAQDETLATLVHYGAHATAFGSGGAVSRDWPGVMCDIMENKTGAPVMFLNGAIGDVAPRTTLIRIPKEKNRLHSIREVGYRAATDALEVYKRIVDFKEDAPLKVISAPQLYEYDKLPPLEMAEKMVKKLEEHKNGFGSEAFEYHRWKKIFDAYKNEDLPKGWEYMQTILRIGPLAIVPFPGELFSGISLRLRAFSPAMHTLCTSVSNGYFTYIPTQEALCREGYEIWMAKAFNGYGFADNIDDSLVEQNLKLLKQIF